MPASSPDSSGKSSRRPSPLLNPVGYLRNRRNERFQRQRQELRAYLEVATPVALAVDGLYRDWRKAVEEPIQDAQKAANLSGFFWWQVVDQLRTFKGVVPPEPARQYHRAFVEALRSASEGAEIAKNGFRFNKFFLVSRGIFFLDRYLELMEKAEGEMGQLVRKYRLIEDPAIPEE